MRLSTKRNKIARKSRSSKQINIKTEINATEAIESIVSFYISNNLKRVDLKDAIMCVFSSGKKEISFESDRNAKIKIKIFGTGAYPITQSFSFLQLEKLFSDHAKKKAGK